MRYLFITLSSLENLILMCFHFEIQKKGYANRYSNSSNERIFFCQIVADVKKLRAQTNESN